MIPHGLNPHGLENRTLTFSVLENNVPVFTCQSTNRLYCWATFSDQLKSFLLSTYQIPENEVNLTIEQIPDEVSWNSATKYVSKEHPGNHFMVHGNQTFYYQTWVESVVPDFATVYVLDTSGSMSMYGGVKSDKDKTQVKYAITGEIYEYNCYPISAKNSKMYVYSAAKLSSMVASEAVFGTIPFGDASLSEIWGAVNPFITGVMKTLSGSESMVTNLYYAIASTVQRMFYGEGATTPGAGCALTAASFIMLTDESIFTPDTLDNIGWL